jgi:hypothetical protein
VTLDIDSLNPELPMVVMASRTVKAGLLAGRTLQQ